MLTNRLLDFVEKECPEEYESYKEVVGKIYNQVSDFSKEKIKNIHNLPLVEEITYTSEVNLIEKGIDFDLLYYYKSGKSVCVEYEGSFQERAVKMEEDVCFCVEVGNDKVYLSKYLKKM